MFLPEVLEISFIIEDIIIKAASQKTGIDNINPNIFRVTGILSSPKNEKKLSTIFLVDPVSINILPNNVPIKISGPIPKRIFLNPTNTNDNVFKKFISNKRPEINALVISVKYGLNLYLTDIINNKERIITSLNISIFL
tara:strand:- start:22915 stop:23331 length:417 start_codon:yes stop_codon:yes gene_type:complete